jgi:hypothetical protein
MRPLLAGHFIVQPVQGADQLGSRKVSGQTHGANTSSRT